MAFRTDERMEPYALEGLETFNEAMRSHYFAKPMAKIRVGATTLARIARGVVGGPARRGFFFRK